ncbi:MAG TPA: threonine/serine dehydratase [Bacillales bacterium]|nr:threonine/serine dehydratase [Bacillales bacterium]
MILLQDIEAARANISDTIHRTPILTSDTLSSRAGNRIFLKSEHLQKTGSFKIRGATNKVKALAKEGVQHVVTASSGNHGQAVSYVSGRLGIRATIVVPEDAPRCKVEAIQDYGAEVLYGGTTSKTRLAKAGELAAEEGTVFVPPYDDPLVMAGQGTTGLEILEQVKDADAVYVPIGGGGLVSGISTAVKETNPRIQVIGVEPALASDTLQSVENEKITPITGSTTIADGLRSLQPGDLTFPVIQKYVDDIVLVSEEEIKEAFSFLLERMKQLVEPSGAVSVAAAMTNKAGVHGKNVVAVISGGNVAPERIGSIFVK